MALVSTRVFNSRNTPNPPKIIRKAVAASGCFFFLRAMSQRLYARPLCNRYHSFVTINTLYAGHGAEYRGGRESGVWVATIVFYLGGVFWKPSAALF